ncbi:hypothetical protein, partial [Paenibacillus vulneris]
GRHPCSWLTVGVRQPPFGTFTLEMTPMLGVHKNQLPASTNAGIWFFQSKLMKLSETEILPYLN